jgi:hypothetical protein
MTPAPREPGTTETEPAPEPVPTDPVDTTQGNPNTDLDHPQEETVPATQEGGPRQPTEEELVAVEVSDAPAAIDATAVDTVDTEEGDKKVGWQVAPVRPELLEEPCFHTAIVQARKQVPAFDVGHEWVCHCGTIFVVHINRGGKKTLVEKSSLPPTEAAGLNVG